MVGIQLGKRSYQVDKYHHPVVQEFWHTTITKYDTKDLQLHKFSIFSQLW